jgi:tetratricopeptide (TPR) repeat protein
MSQTELAGADMSASYVSLLESGRRTATPAIVAVLADRLGCTADYLLQGHDPDALERVRLSLSYAELALRNGAAADALSQLDTLRAGNTDMTAEDRWRARRLRAKALEGLGRLEEALTEIEAMREQARQERRHDDLLRLTVDAVRCYQEAGDVGYAVDVGESTLAAIRDQGLTGSDTHAELASSVLGAYYERGDLVRAQRIVTEVLDVVEQTGSPRARAAVYWNASLVAEQRDDMPTALLLAERALAVYAESDDVRALARLRVAYGWLLLRCLPPRPDEARSQLRASLEDLTEVGSEVDLAYCETELARAELLLDRPQEALRLAGSAVSRLGSAPRPEHAHTSLVRARALLALGRRDEAVDAYRAAATMLGGLELSRHAAAAWRELADAFAELGMLEDATLAYQQALTDAGVRAAPDVRYAQPGRIRLDDPSSRPERR